jgi:hypothetical protein
MEEEKKRKDLSEEEIKRKREEKKKQRQEKKKQKKEPKVQVKKEAKVRSYSKFDNSKIFNSLVR